MTRAGPQAYGEASYWDHRYLHESGPFDWYQHYTALAPFFSHYLSPSSSILMVGCGNSVLSEDMVNNGYREIVNIDISSVVIEAMQKKYKDLSQLKYITMDVRDMRSFENGQFDAVIDKGMLDSLMCGSNAFTSVSKMLEEIYRVLKPGGVYILITYGGPRVRVPHLKGHKSSWKITLHVLPKPGARKEVESSSLDVLVPVHMTEDGTLASDFSADDSNLHYVYVCTKGEECQSFINGEKAS